MRHGKNGAKPAGKTVSLPALSSWTSAKSRLDKHAGGKYVTCVAGSLVIGRKSR